MTQQGESVESQLANSLNKDCHCITVDWEALRSSLEAHLSESGLPEQLLGIHSRLFSASPVFLSQPNISKMAQLIHAVDRVVDNAGYREIVLAAAPDTARQAFGPRGVFFGYDFHMGADGPQLIEINTNAGGVLLNFYLAMAQRACCTEFESLLGGVTQFSDIENQLITMFKDEFRLQCPTQTLRTIAIVDNDPEAQFLYPEFLLFQSLFQRHGIRAIIADPKAFTLQGDSLRLGETRVDLVYNRLTDFYLETPECAYLKEAYLKGFAVFTPSPQAYALYADKRNLILNGFCGCGFCDRHSYDQ